MKLSKPLGFLVVAISLAVCGKAYSQNAVLFEEHFEKNSKGWPVGEDQWAIRKIRNGKYYMECQAYQLPTSGTAWTTAPGLTLPDDNFKIQCQTTWLKNRNTNGSFHSYGFQVGMYRFELYANGDRRLMFWDGKQDNVVIDFGGARPSLYNRGQGVVDVTIEIQNGTAKLFGNDELLLERKIGSAKGELQLRVWHSEVVEYDDLIVTTLASESQYPPRSRRIATEANFCQKLDSVYLSVITRSNRLQGPLSLAGDAGYEDYWSLIQLTPNGSAFFTLDDTGGRTFRETSIDSAEKITQLYNKYLGLLKQCYGDKKKIVSNDKGTLLRTTLDADGEEKFITLEATVTNPATSLLGIYIDWGD